MSKTATHMSQLYKDKREKAAGSKEAHTKKLIERVYIARTYKALIDSAGWKLLLNDYLDEQMNPNRFMDLIYSEAEDIREAAMKIQALWEMMAHISSMIKDGEKAVKELNTLGVRDSEY